MSKEEEHIKPIVGLTIGELKTFINGLPSKFDNFTVINGEFGASKGSENYYRVEKPVINILVDEDTEDLCILHQTESEIDKLTTNETPDETTNDKEVSINKD